MGINIGESGTFQNNTFFDEFDPQYYPTYRCYLLQVISLFTIVNI